MRLPNPSTRRRDVCLYCQGREDITDDHVPPKLIFPEPRTSDLITVPVCWPCHRGFQKDDEYLFFSVVTPAATRDPVAHRHWYDKLKPHLDHSPGFKSYITAAYSMREQVAPDGRVVTAKSVELDSARVRRAVTRIVLGVLWRHGYPVPDREMVRVDVQMGPRVDGQPSAKESADQVLGDAPYVTVGDGVFRYRYRVLQPDLGQSDWFMEFYHAMHFFVSLRPGDRHVSRA